MVSLLEALLSVVVAAVFYMYLDVRRRYEELRVSYAARVVGEAERRAREMFEDWVRRRLDEVRMEVRRLLSVSMRLG